MRIIGDCRSASLIAPLRLSNDPMTLVMLTVPLPTRAEELRNWAEVLDSAWMTSFGYRNEGCWFVDCSMCICNYIKYRYIDIDMYLIQCILYDVSQTRCC